MSRGGQAARVLVSAAVLAGRCAVAAASAGVAAGMPHSAEAPPAVRTQSASHAALDLHDIFALERHEGPSRPAIVWIERGRAYLFREPGDAGDWIRVETSSGKRSVWLREADLVPPLTVGAYEASADGRWVLLQTERVKRWRRSHTAVHWVYDRKQRSLHPLTDAALSPQIHAHFSPDGTRIGFVSGGDLYVVDSKGGEPFALTDDGSDTVRNGDPDWLYEEELEFDRAWWWSPDGEMLAFLRFNDTGVPTMPLLRFGEADYPAVEQLRYPKPGTAYPRVSIWVSTPKTPASRFDPCPCPEDPAAPCPQIVRLQWTGRELGLMYQQLDRAQRRLTLSVWSGGTSSIGIDSSSAWVDLPPDVVSFDGPIERELLWTSEVGGFRHLQHSDITLARVKSLTSGSWDVTDVYGVDLASGMVLVQTTRGGPLTRELALVPLEGGEPRPVGEPGGWHEADLSPDGRHFVETVSSYTRRSRLLLRRIDGTLVRELTDDPMEDLAGVDLGEARFVTVPVQDEAGQRIELNGQLLLPPGFDPARRYPTVIFCYGGPGSQVVCDRWGGKRMLFHRRLAQDGMVVFLLDNRGTGGRGAAFTTQMHRRLGHFEVLDQLVGARWLVEQGFADPARIAIWGWSYGGYTAGLTLLRGQGAIAAAACVAPVVDWRLYDAVYTERYMGLPDENAEGYAAASLLTYADDLQGKLLLVHGIADDNVHAQHTLRLAGALQQAGKPFEMMLYPDKAHGMEGKPTQEHVYRLLRDFFHRALGMPPLADVREPAAADTVTSDAKTPSSKETPSP